ncbi:MAG: alpha-N-arabinofuranosidase, partial [Oscillospiraceae bacterium]|nr:alpha-N-arabinofuranosidase [Oscillospiraceae bacterium]
VLQSLVLTEGEKMVLTPTYHVFDLYKSHQDGEAVYCHTENQTVGTDNKIPMVSCSASIKDGKLTVTMANCSIDEDAEVSCNISGVDAASAEAKILTEDCRALNDFENGERVVPKDFSVSLSGSNVSAVLPPCSVVSVILS